LKLFRNQNPGLSLRFDPKFAVEFAEFSDSELLTIVAGETNKGTVALLWRVKLHAVKQLGRRRAVTVANFGNSRAMQTLMAKARTRRNIRLQEGKDGTVGFTLSDVDPDFDDLDPIKAMKELDAWQRRWESWDSWWSRFDEKEDH
jgi:hypothetical protein